MCQGSNNTAADTLSRLKFNSLHRDDTSPVVDFRALALAQVDNPDLARLQTRSSLRFHAVPLMESPLCAISPHLFRDRVSALLPVAMSGQADIRRRARSGPRCQRVKIHCHST